MFKEIFVNDKTVLASQVKEEADKLADRYGVSAEYLEANDERALRRLVSNARIVISLLPYDLHATVAKVCLSTGAHMVTASYVSADVQELHKT